MKVLQINSVCGYGSTGRIAVEICESLEHNGHDCLIAYGRGSASQSVNSSRIGSDLGVNIHGALSRLTDRHGFYSHGATRKFLKQAEAFNPDVIHLHNIHGYYINIKLLFEWLAKMNKPVVWTLHDCWAFTGHCSHFDYVKCEKWKTGCKRCPQKKEYPASICIDASKANYKSKQELFTSIEKMIIATPSEWLAGKVRESFLKSYPVFAIPNGIDLSVFRPTKNNFREKNGLTDKTILLGVANKWDARKGIEDFIRLSEDLGPEYKVVLVGVDDKQSLPKNILRIKRTQNLQELIGIYSAADIYINTSVEETMGMTTVEALACGTPVIVYNATAVPETVDDTCGIIIEKGDYEGLKRAVRNFSDYTFSVASCLHRAVLYSKEDMHWAYLKRYEELTYNSRKDK
ncbi:MAG: glycosyltransferase [Clostridiales bacterium]|nr:glycosyltransferase [Clostridiales bacterium]